MSIKGFNVGGVTQRYDYNALDNIPKGEGLSEEAKQAILQIAEKVAYIDANGQTYYNALHDAFYPPKVVVLLTAVFEQGSMVIYDNTALDDLKQYLTVTAKYDDNTTAILANSVYTLSGLLEAGTSTITVAYSGITTTFTVNVTARPTLSSITAVYTQSDTVYDIDTLDSLKDDLVVTANYSDSSAQTVSAVDYTLSGTLTVGTSTITVNYGGKTTTFDVVVTSSVLYLIENRAVTTGEMIQANTGTVKALSASKDTTILLDCTFTSVPTSGNGSTIAILCGWSGDLNNWGIRIGKKTGNSNVLTGRWMSSTDAENMNVGSLSVNTRNRFAIVHEANSKTVTVYYKKGTGAKASWTKTDTVFYEVGIGLGSQVNGASSMCAGTISLFKVSIGISNDELDAFFA